MGFLYAANLGPLPPARAPADLPPSKVFHGIGVASLHATLLDSANDVHFLFKSSPFGSQSHGHNPQNSFQLNAYGEALLTTCVYRDWHGSPFHYKWCHSTVAHNAVLVNGEGQVMHSQAPLGRIVAERLTPAWDYIAGDAAAAYGGRLTRCLRHVAFVKPDLIVLYDDLAAAEPATFQFMLHALKPLTVDERQATVSVEQPKAGVTARYLATAALKFRQWDGYEPKPERQFPNQWHVEASTQDKAREVGMLTVLVPYRTGRRRDVALARLESPTAVGVRATEGGKALATVAFRKAGVAGTAAVDGLTVDGAVAVRPGAK
jgi:hypothetical protein